MDNLNEVIPKAETKNINEGCIHNGATRYESTPQGTLKTCLKCGKEI